MNPCFKRRARRGFTLVELVVVMAILAALAGIVVPLFPNMITRAHTAAGATNLSEIGKVVQVFAATHGDNYPNQLDSIIDETGVIAAYVPSDGTSLTTAAPSASDVSALRGAGISSYMQMIARPSSLAPYNPWNPTFFPYGPDSTVMPTATALATSTKLAYLDPAVACMKFALPADGKYVVFGLGQYSTIAGVNMDEVPVWFNPTPDYDPDTVYARFGLVFQTADAGGVALSRARFVGPVEFAAWGTMTKNDNLSFNYTLK